MGDTPVVSGDKASLHPPRAGTLVYLDYQSTTPTDRRVVDAMLPYFHERFGNPHSHQHPFGWRAEEAVERARGQIARLIGARPREIVFTSGATEANNLAIKGAVRAAIDAEPGRRHVVTVATEHKCVLETCRHLEREGAEVSYLAVQPNGLIDLDQLASVLTPATALVSIMAVNNEIGVIQPLDEIGRLCRERGVLFHTDAAQALGKIPLDVESMAIDLLSASSHKTYGPMGTGALYVSRRPGRRLAPLFDGGGQERGIRSGTLPLPLCVGFGEACAIAAREMDSENERLRKLRDRFLAVLHRQLTDVQLNGDEERRIPGNLNLAFGGIEAQDLFMDLGDVAISSGSACSSATVEPSHVLSALGLDDARARGSVRIGFGRFSSEEEVDYAAARIAAVVAHLRALTSV